MKRSESEPDWQFSENSQRCLRFGRHDKASEQIGLGYLLEKKTVVETAATGGFGRVRARRGTSPSDWRTGLEGSTPKSFRRQSPYPCSAQFTITARLIRILRRGRLGEFLEPRII